MTAEELLEEHLRVCDIISNPDASDAQVRAAIESFKKLDAPAAAIEACLAGIEGTLEQRAPGHDPGR